MVDEPPESASRLSGPHGHVEPPLAMMHEVAETQARVDAPRLPLQANWRLVWFATSIYGGLAMIALALRAWHSGEWLPLADLDPTGVPLLPTIAGLAGAGILLAWSPWMMRHWAWSRHLAVAMRETFGPVGWRGAFLLGLSSGVAEELLFRGALQPLLGPVVATILFALAHGIGWWSLFAGLAGAGLAALTIASEGNLWPAILAHVCLNTVNLTRFLAPQDCFYRR